MDEVLPGYRLPHSEVDLVKLFGASEGEIAVYYGHIRQGKTFGSTQMGIEAADTGLPVYFNYPVKYIGSDQRYSLLWILISLIWPWKDRFYHMKPGLVKYFQISDSWAQSQGYDDFWHWFKTRTDCLIVADEGHVIFDSYRKTFVSMEQRMAVLETGHFSRRLIIVSQRPTAIHVTARANCNVFYKFERKLRWPFLLFKRTEYQDMAMETVDETKPLSTKWIIGSRRVMKAFDSKYLRGGMKTSQNIDVDIYDFYYREKFQLLSVYLQHLVEVFKLSITDTSVLFDRVLKEIKRPFIKQRPPPALAGAAEKNFQVPSGERTLQSSVSPKVSECDTIELPF